MGKKLLLALLIGGAAVAVFLYRDRIPLLKDNVTFLATWPTADTVIQVFGNPTSATVISGGSIAAVGGALTIAGKLKGYLSSATDQLKGVTSVKDQLSAQFNQLQTVKDDLEGRLGQATSLKTTLESQLSTANTQIQDLTSQNSTLTDTVQKQSQELLRMKDFETKYLEAQNKLMELRPPNLH